MDSFFFSHVLQGLIVRADDRRDRRPDDGGKVGINRFGSLAEFIDQAVVAAEDGVHIAQAGTEDGTLFPLNQRGSSKPQMLPAQPPASQMTTIPFSP